MRRRPFIALPLALAARAAAGAGAEAAATLDDAINKAGRQRMLSQRLAKAWFARGLAVEPELAARVSAASTALFERQLAELRAFAPRPEIRAVYARLEEAWAGYKALLLRGAPERAAGAEVLDRAGRVLELAHEGTGLLEALSERPSSHWVNVCGRQRMLSQRLAALHLGASWGVGPASLPAEIAHARAEFMAAQGALEQAPVDSPQIRDELRAADLQWEFFDAALRELRPGQPDAVAMSHVFTTSERILEVMDGVTGRFAKLG
jgi:hypothetical protein